MLDIFLIFIGAGLGGVLRYGISNLVSLFLGRGFPYGTLLVNISGCFMMGFFFIFLVDRFGSVGSNIGLIVLIGFLGGYTTFSAFSLETLQLFEKGAYISATLNILLSVFLCLAATWLGILGARH